MALYTLKYHYVDDADVVNVHRPAHREYLKELLETGELLAAGPHADDASAGGLLLFSVDSQERVEELASNDPFVTRGIVVSQDVHEWKVAFGTERFN